MKKYFYLSSLIILFYSIPFISQGQAPYAYITGTPCVGSTLTLNSSAQLSKIVWIHNTTRIDSTYINWLQGGITVAGQFNGIGGYASNQLNAPTSVFVDGSGNIYVADANNNRVQKWIPGATSGITVAGNGISGSAANQLNNPSGVFVDASGNVYVADKNNSRVQKWAPAATSGTTVAGNGTLGNASSQLNGPAGIFVDGSSNVYVSDAGNNRIQKWASGATNGTTVAGQSSGVGGSGANQLSGPSGVFVDGNGNIFVADAGNNRIQKWVQNASNGATVAGGNGPGNNSNQFNSPCGVFVDGIGNIYVADQANSRVQQWRAGTSTGIAIAGGNGLGTNNNQLSNPASVFVDNLGNLYVSDASNNRVQLFLPNIADTLVAPALGSYTASVSLLSGPTITSSGLAVADTFRPSITVPMPSPSNKVCSGDSMFFTSSITNGGGSPVYQWYKNSTPIPGATGASYASNAFSNGDSVTCFLTPSLSCPVIPYASSSPITVTVNPVVLPFVTLSLNASDTICVNQQVTFTAIGSGGGNNPTYLWKLNGGSLSVPADSATFTTDTLKSGDKINCIMTSSAPCTVMQSVQSQFVQFIVDTFVLPTVTISVSPGDTLCKYDTVTFSAIVQNGGANPVYQWFDNSYLIAGAISSSYSNVASAYNGHIFVCYVTSSLNCTINPLAGSNPIEITTTGVLPFSASITASATHLTQSNQHVTFSASTINGGPSVSYQWRKNTINIPGANAANYLDSTLVNNDQVDCIAYTNDPCANLPSVVSNLILITSTASVSLISGVFPDLQVIPNPSSGHFLVKASVQAGNTDHFVRIEFLNMLGEIVYYNLADIANGELYSQIDLPDYINNGVYFLRVKLSDAYKISRVVVNR